MTDRDYLFLRRLFFWIFFIGFLILTPFIVAFSLGFKLDLGARKLERTGAISISSSPRTLRFLSTEIKSAKTPPS